jgi:ElaB/YqjD/DUF883 family membrane-anchored ribosome-binding protein
MANLRRKARRRARRQYADDFALDVRAPRRAAKQSFARQRDSLRGAGAMASGYLDDALASARSTGLDGRELRQYKAELQGMQTDIPAGIKRGVVSARQDMRDQLAGISSTAADLRSARADEAHSIYQSLRAKERDRLAKQRERVQGMRADKREDRKDMRLEVRKGVAKLRQGLGGDPFTHSLNVARLRQDGNARTEALDRLITSDIDPKAAKRALARFMRRDPAAEYLAPAAEYLAKNTGYALGAAPMLVQGIQRIVGK